MSLRDLDGRWWLCPNQPRCGHAAVLHDIADYDDPSPRCCVDDCPCGSAPADGEERK